MQSPRKCLGPQRAQHGSRTRRPSGREPTIGGNEEQQRRGLGREPEGGQTLTADFLMDKAQRTESLSLSSGKGHPGLCPAAEGHPCSMHQLPHPPALPLLFTSSTPPQRFYFYFGKFKKQA